MNIQYLSIQLASPSLGGLLANVLSGYGGGRCRAHGATRAPACGHGAHRPVSDGRTGAGAMKATGGSMVMAIDIAG